MLRPEIFWIYIKTWQTSSPAKNKSQSSALSQKAKEIMSNQAANLLAHIERPGHGVLGRQMRNFPIGRTRRKR